jgi:hypothetical protein
MQNLHWGIDRSWRLNESLVASADTWTARFAPGGADDDNSTPTRLIASVEK